MRLIDANALKEKASMRGLCLRPMVTAYQSCVSVSDIDNAPTVDAVEVVRCKDCKYSYYNKYCTNEQWKDNGATVTIEAGDFCSYAEGKEG